MTARSPDWDAALPVVAIVPARDEADLVGSTVEALRSIAQVGGVLVVDDGSSDETAAVARAAGARVLRGARTRGKGAAVRAGLDATAAEVVLLADADLGASAVALEALLPPVLTGASDMTVAAPPPSGPSGFGLVERLARNGIVRATGVRLARPLSGQRCLRREVLDGARLPGGFGLEVALGLHALRHGFRVRELEVAIEHRRTGRDAAGFAHRARQGLHVLGALVAHGVRWSR